MADYVPIFKPGTDITQTVGATPVVGGNLVMLSAANTVIPTTGATAAWLGVATTDAAVGAKVGITSGGVQELVANGAIAVGAMVMAAAGGKVQPIGAGTFGQNVGVAMTAAAADNDKIHVKMNR
jgi:ABC-type Fe3+ transport system substrate-binding protein